MQICSFLPTITHIFSQLLLSTNVHLFVCVHLSVNQTTKKHRINHSIYHHLCHHPQHHIHYHTHHHSCNHSHHHHPLHKNHLLISRLLSFSACLTIKILHLYQVVEAVYEMVLPGNTISHSEIQRQADLQFRKLDQDKDGIVSKEEFICFCNSNPTVIQSMCVLP